MNIIVINGSPRGLRGTTAQYIEHLAQRLPQHRFQVVEVARGIRRIERDEARFAAIVAQIEQADALIWCCPVYLMLVPAQLKRFIELLFERLGPSALAGKLASTITSSAHFYDHTAHDYLRDISADLGMSYVQGFSGGMNDLQGERGLYDLLCFAKSFLGHASGQLPVDAAPQPIRWSPPAYAPELSQAVAKTGGKRVVVISDARPEDRNLRNMIEQLERSLSHRVDRLELHSLRMDGGCLGCMGCTDSGVCGYKDDYAAAYDELVKPADVVIWAGAVRDRFFSARMKTFIDRYFRNGHRPAGGRQAVGYLVSGPLAQLSVMNQVMETTVQVAQGQRLGTVTDEHPDPAVTSARLQSLAKSVDSWLEDPWFRPANFLGVGGLKIFRDLVYENKGILSADHRFYRAHGFYDFPQYDLKKRLLMTLILWARRIPFVEKRLRRALRAGQRGKTQAAVPAAAGEPETSLGAV